MWCRWVLTRVFAPELVDEVIAQAGRTEVRHRSLPARVMAYFSIGMALYSQGSYEDVYAQLTDGLSWASRWQESYSPPSKSAISQARVRLGSGAGGGVVRPGRGAGGRPDTAGGWLAGRRLVAIDGMCVDVADSPANDEFFGRAGVSRVRRQRSRWRAVVALAECGTHAIFAASVGTYKQSKRVVESLLTHLDQSMLLIADRGFSLCVVAQSIPVGCGPVVACQDRSRERPPRHVKDLPDGSWLADLRQTHSAQARRTDPIRVRVIDYDR